MACASDAPPNAQGQKRKRATSQKKPAATTTAIKRPAAAKPKSKVEKAPKKPSETVLGGTEKTTQFPAALSLASDCSGVGTERLAAVLAFGHRSAINHNYTSEISEACRPGQCFVTPIVAPRCQAPWAKLAISPGLS